jgi:hypothetical protein
MKKKFLKWVFGKYRVDIEDVFISDMFGDVPADLTENSLKFLLSGGTNFDKWMRVSSYALQRKLQQPNKDVGSVAVAGLIFFKTLAIMMSRLEQGKKLLPVDEQAITAQQDLEKDLRGVDEFFTKKVDNYS